MRYESLFAGVRDGEAIGDDGAGSLLIARRAPGPDWLAQLAATEFGNEGLRYCRLDLQRHFAAAPPSRYLELRRDGALQATYYLAEQALSVNGQTVTGVYRGLLTVARDARGRGIGGAAVKATLAWLAALAAGHPRPVMSYGCIDATNRTSLSLLRRSGARELGALRSQLIYRQWLGADARLEEIDAPQLRREIQDHYADCAILGLSGRSEPYLCLRDGSGVVAGARVTRTRLAMPASGGRWDWLLHGLLPRVGFARRRFDPRAFTYLRLRDVVLRDGHAAQWSRFVGALMSRFETHMALLVLDPHTRIYARLDRARLFGRFARATRQELLVLATACNEIARPCLEARGEPLAITSPDM